MFLILKNCFSYSLLFLSLLVISQTSAQDFKVELLDDSDGFSTSIIFSIIQDKQGFIWFGTAYKGLFRYDGKRIVSYRHDPNNPQSIPSDSASNIRFDKNNNIWIGSWGDSVSVFDPVTEHFTHYKNDPLNPHSISGRYVQTIFQDSDNKIWLGTQLNGLNLFDAETQKFIRYPFNTLNGGGTSGDRIWDIIQVDDFGLWIATNSGLNYFNKTTGKFTYYFPDKVISKIGKNKTRRIIQLNKQYLLIGTDLGLQKFNLSTKKYSPVPVQNNQYIGEVYSILKTSFNDIWITTANGLFTLKNKSKQLEKLNLGIEDKCGQVLFEDRQHDIWLTCEGKGVYKIIPNKGFKLLNEQPYQRITALTTLNNGKLLISNQSHGLSRLDPVTKQLTQVGNISGFEAISLIEDDNGTIYYSYLGKLYKVSPNGNTEQIAPSIDNPVTQYFTNIGPLAIDKQNRIWLGTDHGIIIYDHSIEKYQYIAKEKAQYSELSNNNIRTIYIDKQNRIWIGTHNGLNLWFENEQTFKPFLDSKNNAPTNSNIITNIFEDNRNQLWIGTKNGLFQLDTTTGKTKNFGREFGLINTEIGAIQQDKNDSIWLLTNLGLSRINIKSTPYQVKNYDQRDGLSTSRYFSSSMPITPDGTLFYSSRNGLYYFNPDDIDEIDHDANIVLTSFEVLGSPANKKVNVSKLDKIQLNYDQNYIKFEFSTLDYTNSRKINYQYKLEGIDKNWIKAGTNNQAIYNNLSGGQYTFKVKASYNASEYYSKQLAVPVDIAIPFWKQWWMYIIYIAIIALAIFLYLQRKVQLKNEQIAKQQFFVQQLEQQVKEKTASIREESKKLMRANNVKSEFLANMSHEIRTPLTAVIGQAEAIINNEIPSQSINEEVEVIHKNSLYLLELLNNILDLSKIEANKLELEFATTDLHQILNDLQHIFTEQAESKGLQFSIEHELPTLFTIKTDALRLKQVLINLCANAIKFTHQGKVTLRVLPINNKLIFKITDTGIGLSKEQIKHIFDSFTQGDNSISRRFGGSGLGLSLTKEIVSLMNGFISVESELDVGSTFSVVIPLEVVANTVTDNVNSNIKVNNNNSQAFYGSIILAEDHDDNRRLISRWLTSLGLTVYSASNGKEAVDIATLHQPDLILLDLQMPVMDGIEAFHKIKELGFSNPIIALTANAMTHEIKQLLSMGFTQHLAKPINREKFTKTLAKYCQSVESKHVSTTKEITWSDLLTEFLQNLQYEKQKIKQLLETEAYETFISKIQRLAITSKLFDFQELANICNEAEQMIKNNNTNNLNHLITRLFDKIDGIINNMSNPK